MVYFLLYVSSAGRDMSVILVKRETLKKKYQNTLMLYVYIIFY